MNRPDNIIPLHRGTYRPDFPRHVPPRTGEQLQSLTGDKDAVFVRGEPRDVREFDPVVARLDGPPVHETIGEPENPFAHFTFADALVCGIVCFLIGWLLATGGVL